MLAPIVVRAAFARGRELPAEQTPRHREASEGPMSGPFGECRNGIQGRRL